MSHGDSMCQLVRGVATVQATVTLLSYRTYKYGGDVTVPKLHRDSAFGTPEGRENGVAGQKLYIYIYVKLQLGFRF
jgi:hypothetical protein